MNRKYTPRRARQRWLEGAPEYVLDVWDWGPKTPDRYTVLFGGSLLEPSLLEHREVHCLHFSEGGRGFSSWDSMNAYDRPSHLRIRWLDLSEDSRKHVINRATAK